ncbi:hypothetical protein E4U59_004403 [Claviceps monticola]|nr:hypothetical protein E4U59_004403 [Claviceps monticola]
MPRPSPPLTSGSSTNTSSLCNAQSVAAHLASQLSAPTMPPTAECSSFNASSHIPLPSSSSSRSSGPSQVAETVKTRRRASAPRGNTRDNANCPFALPPPPTRSRKIIQMRPRTQADSTTSSPTKPSSRAGSKTTFSAVTAKTAAKKDTSDSGSGSTDQGVKRKQPPNATSAAGRKTARKTAHSLIERRRRGKMNEEFDVLRGLVPACTLQMHKLSVLNCTIEYVQYLQDCVSKLSSQAAVERTSLPSTDEFSTSFFTQQRNRLREVDISDSDSVSPRFLAQSDYTHRLSTSTSTSATASSFSSVSPSIHTEDARRGPHGYQHHYNYTFSASNPSDRFLPPPALGPHGHGTYAQGGLQGSGPTSFAICAQSDVDSEATAALLMLNNDRRGPNPASSPRRVSVRDLLSN